MKQGNLTNKVRANVVLLLFCCRFGCVDRPGNSAGCSLVNVQKERGILHGVKVSRLGNKAQQLGLCGFFRVSNFLIVQVCLNICFRASPCSYAPAVTAAAVTKTIVLSSFPEVWFVMLVM